MGRWAHWWRDQSNIYSPFDYPKRARLLHSEKYYSTFIPIALNSPISFVGIGTDQRLALQDEEDGRWQGE
jgi:hypothetical protein